MDSIDEQRLTENDIRPDVLMAEENRLFLEDIRRLMEKRDAFVSVTCPACGADEAQRVFSKCGQPFEACQQCETVFANPRPTAEMLSEYYATSAYYQFWNRHVFPQSEDARRAKVFRPRVARLGSACKRLGLSGGCLLEVGAGFGTFCEEVVRAGLFDQVIAVEPVPELADSCRRRGLEVIEEPIERAQVRSGSVDVVASFEVIEHLFSPGDFLVACSQFLRPGGLLVLTCPNVKGFDISVLGEKSDSMEPEHLNYFHPKSLSRLLIRTGFTVLELATPGKLDAELVRKKALSGELDLASRPFLRCVLLDQWEGLGAPFQRFLAESGLSSHMWTIAQRAG